MGDDVLAFVENSLVAAGLSQLQKTGTTAKGYLLGTRAGVNPRCALCAIRAEMDGRDRDLIMTTFYRALWELHSLRKAAFRAPSTTMSSRSVVVVCSYRFWALGDLVAPCELLQMPEFELRTFSFDAAGPTMTMICGNLTTKD